MTLMEFFLEVKRLGLDPNRILLPSGLCRFLIKQALAFLQGVDRSVDDEDDDDGGDDD